MSLSVAPQSRSKPNLRSSSWVLCRVVIVITILFTSLFCMRSASATCGSYLYRNGNPVSHRSMPMDELDGVSIDIGNLLPEEIPVRHCSGPNCSSSPLPLAPLPAAPSNLIRGFDQSAVLESLLPIQMIRCAIEIPTSERGARFEPSIVFRPPAA